MNYHQQNLSKVCSFCGLASERLRAYSWKRNKCQFNEIQRENSAMHLTTLYCYTCRKKFLDPLNSACRPEAVNKAKLAIVSNMHKFEEHVDTNCFICVQFSEGEQNPSVTAEGDNNTTVFSFQNHLEALEITCSLCAKIDKHNLKTYTFAWARIKAEFDKIMDINRSSIHPRPKKEVFCFTCRQGQGGGHQKTFY